MIQVKFTDLKNQQVSEALRKLVNADLAFGVSYNVMRIAKKFDAGIKDINSFLVAKMKVVGPIASKPEAEMNEEEKALIQKTNEQVSSFMTGEWGIDRNPLMMNDLTAASLSAADIAALVDAGIIYEENKEVQNGKEDSNKESN